MARFLRSLLALASLAALSGCIIGTWPTPENRSPQDEDRAQATGNGGTDTGSPVAREACDGLDNDVDGSVDEGCPCVEQVRGCVAAVDGDCGFGVQRCGSGVWQLCSELQGPFVAARTPSVEIVEVSPPTMLLGDATPLTVSVEPVAACDGMRVPSVSVTLIAADPDMRVRATARDDGSGADRTAADGLFEATLPNAFGPAYAAQELELTAVTILSGQTTTVVVAVPLEAP